jgi:hypothetical protein
MCAERGRIWHADIYGASFWLLGGVEVVSDPLSKV